MRKSPLKNRLLSSAIVFSFLVTNLNPPPGFAKALPSSPNAVVGDHEAPNLSQPSAILVPEKIGKIEEAFKGNSTQTVILVRDAHSIPEAQKNIQELIAHFQKNYGLRFVGAEGADGELDAQVFRSFPDKEKLARVFEQYAAKGELTGVNAAAVFDPTVGAALRGRLEETGQPPRAAPTIYRGLEDWNLYVESLELYRAAMAVQPGLEENLEGLKKEQEAEKQKVYSKPLLEIDQALQAFHESRGDLSETLKKFAAIRRPQTGSAMALLLEEIESDKGTWGRDELKREQKYSQISGRFLEEFEAYAYSVKESLLSTEKERRLDRESHQLDLFKKLMKLELSREEWEEIKKSQDTSHKTQVKDMQYHLAFYQNTEKRDEVLFENLMNLSLRGVPQGRRSNPKSLEIASLTSFARNDGESVLLVAGGFHTEALAARLKEQGISYVVVRPAIARIPEEDFYREQMRGDFSWKNYFEAENGKVNLYKAFLRATRDKLLGVGAPLMAPGSQAQEGAMNRAPTLKEWRDQLIRDLAAQGRIETAAGYLSLLDESAKKAAEEKTSELKKKWMRNIDEFIAKFHGLESQGKLNEQSILEILKPSSTPTFAAPILSPRSQIRADFFTKPAASFPKDNAPTSFPHAVRRESIVSATPRSEMRSKVNEAFQKLETEIKLEDIRDGDLLGAIEEKIREGLGAPERGNSHNLKDYIGSMQNGEEIIRPQDLPQAIETEFGRIDLSYLNDVTKYEGPDASAQLARDLYLAHLLGLITISTFRSGVSPGTLTYQLLLKKGIKITLINTSWPDWALLKARFEAAVWNGSIHQYQKDEGQLKFYQEVLGQSARNKHAGNLYSAISSLIPKGLGWRKMSLNLGLVEDLRKDFEEKSKDKGWVEKNLGDGSQLEYYLEFLKSKNLKARGFHAGGFYSAISSLIPEGLDWQVIDLNLGLAEDLRKDFEEKSKDKGWAEKNRGDGSQLKYYLEFLKNKDLKARDFHAGSLYSAISSLIPEGLGWQVMRLNLGLAEDLRKDFEEKSKDKGWVEKNRGDGNQLEYYLEFLKNKDLKARDFHAGSLYSAISSLIPEGFGWQVIGLNLGLAEDLRKDFEARLTDAQWRREHQENLGQVKYYAEAIGISVEDMYAGALYSALSSLLDRELVMEEELKQPARQTLDWKVMKQPMREILEVAPYSSIVIPERGSLGRGGLRSEMRNEAERLIKLIRPLVKELKSPELSAKDKNIAFRHFNEQAVDAFRLVMTWTFRGQSIEDENAESLAVLVNVLFEGAVASALEETVAVMYSKDVDANLQSSIGLFNGLRALLKDKDKSDLTRLQILEMLGKMSGELEKTITHLRGMLVKTSRLSSPDEAIKSAETKKEREHRIPFLGFAPTITGMAVSLSTAYLDLLDFLPEMTDTDQTSQSFRSGLVAALSDMSHSFLGSADLLGMIRQVNQVGDQAQTKVNEYFEALQKQLKDLPERTGLRILKEIAESEKKAKGQETGRQQPAAEVLDTLEAVRGIVLDIPFQIPGEKDVAKWLENLKVRMSDENLSVEKKIASAKEIDRFLAESTTQLLKAQHELMRASSPAPARESAQLAYRLIRLLREIAAGADRQPYLYLSRSLFHGASQALSFTGELLKSSQPEEEKKYALSVLSSIAEDLQEFFLDLTDLLERPEEEEMKNLRSILSPRLMVFLAETINVFLTSLSISGKGPDLKNTAEIYFLAGTARKAAAAIEAISNSEALPDEGKKFIESRLNPAIQHGILHDTNDQGNRILAPALEKLQSLALVQNAGPETDEDVQTQRAKEILDTLAALEKQFPYAPLKPFPPNQPKSEVREQSGTDYFKDKMASPLNLPSNTRDELIAIMEGSKKPFSGIAAGVLAWLATNPPLPDSMQAKEVLWAIRELSNVPGIQRVLDHINIDSPENVIGFLTEIIFAYQKQRQGYVISSMAVDLIPNVEVDMVMVKPERYTLDFGSRLEKAKTILAESKHFPRKSPLSNWMEEEINPKIVKYREALKENKNQELLLEDYHAAGELRPIDGFRAPEEFTILISDSILAKGTKEEIEKTYRALPAAGPGGPLEILPVSGFAATELSEDQAFQKIFFQPADQNQFVETLRRLRNEEMAQREQRHFDGLRVRPEKQPSKASVRTFLRDMMTAYIGLKNPPETESEIEKLRLENKIAWRAYQNLQVIRKTLGVPLDARMWLFKLASQMKDPKIPDAGKQAVKNWLETARLESPDSQNLQTTLDLWESQFLRSFVPQEEKPRSEARTTGADKDWLAAIDHAGHEYEMNKGSLLTLLGPEDWLTISDAIFGGPEDSEASRRMRKLLEPWGFGDRASSLAVFISLILAKNIKRGVSTEIAIGGSAGATKTTIREALIRYIRKSHEYLGLGRPAVSALRTLSDEELLIELLRGDDFLRDYPLLENRRMMRVLHDRYMKAENETERNVVLKEFTEENHKLIRQGYRPFNIYTGADFDDPDLKYEREWVLRVLGAGKKIGKEGRVEDLVPYRDDNLIGRYYVRRSNEGRIQIAIRSREEWILELREDQGKWTYAYQKQTLNEGYVPASEAEFKERTKFWDDFKIEPKGPREFWIVHLEQPGRFPEQGIFSRAVPNFVYKNIGWAAEKISKISWLPRSLKRFLLKIADSFTPFKPIPRDTAIKVEIKSKGQGESKQIAVSYETGAVPYAVERSFTRPQILSEGGRKEAPFLLRHRLGPQTLRLFDWFLAGRFEEHHPDSSDVVLHVRTNRYLRYARLLGRAITEGRKDLEAYLQRRWERSWSEDLLVDATALRTDVPVIPINGMSLAESIWRMAYYNDWNGKEKRVREKVKAEDFGLKPGDPEYADFDLVKKIQEILAETRHETVTKEIRKVLLKDGALNHLKERNGIAEVQAGSYRIIFSLSGPLEVNRTYNLEDEAIKNYREKIAPYAGGNFRDTSEIDLSGIHDMNIQVTGADGETIIVPVKFGKVFVQSIPPIYTNLQERLEAFAREEQSADKIKQPELAARIYENAINLLKANIKGDLEMAEREIVNTRPESALTEKVPDIGHSAQVAHLTDLGSAATGPEAFRAYDFEKYREALKHVPEIYRKGAENILEDLLPKSQAEFKEKIFGTYLKLPLDKRSKPIPVPETMDVRIVIWQMARLNPILMESQIRDLKENHFDKILREGLSVERNGQIKQERLGTINEKILAWTRLYWPAMTYPQSLAKRLFENEIEPHLTQQGSEPLNADFIKNLMADVRKKHPQLRKGLIDALFIQRWEETTLQFFFSGSGAPSPLGRDGLRSEARSTEDSEKRIWVSNVGSELTQPDYIYEMRLPTKDELEKNTKMEISFFYTLDEWDKTTQQNIAFYPESEHMREEGKWTTVFRAPARTALGGMLLNAASKGKSEVEDIRWAQGEDGRYLAGFQAGRLDIGYAPYEEGRKAPEYPYPELTSRYIRLFLKEAIENYLKSTPLERRTDWSPKTVEEGLNQAVENLKGRLPRHLRPSNVVEMVQTRAMLSREAINQKGLLMDFAEFMDAANKNYYGESVKFGAEHDFKTPGTENAPEIGKTFAIYAFEKWKKSGRPENFRMGEIGGGEGAVAAALLSWIAGQIENEDWKNFSKSMEFVHLDRSQMLLDKQALKIQEVLKQFPEGAAPKIRQALFDTANPGKIFDKPEAGFLYNVELLDDLARQKIRVGLDGKVKQVYPIPQVAASVFEADSGKGLFDETFKQAVDRANQSTRKLLPQDLSSETYFLDPERAALYRKLHPGAVTFIEGEMDITDHLEEYPGIQRYLQRNQQRIARAFEQHGTEELILYPSLQLENFYPWLKTTFPEFITLDYHDPDDEDGMDPSRNLPRVYPLYRDESKGHSYKTDRYRNNSLDVNYPDAVSIGQGPGFKAGFYGSAHQFIKAVTGEAVQGTVAAPQFRLLIQTLDLESVPDLGLQALNESEKSQSGGLAGDDRFGGSTEILAKQYYKQIQAEAAKNAGRWEAEAESLIQKLNQARVNPEEVTEIIYPAAGDLDAFQLAGFRRVFPNLEKIHLIDLGYKNSSLADNFKKNIQAAMGRFFSGQKIPEIKFYGNDYFSLTPEELTLGNGRRLWIDKFPGDNAVLRQNKDFYKSTLERNFLRREDLVFTIPFAGTSYDWKNQVLSGLKIPYYDKRDNGVISIVTQDDFSALGLESRFPPDRADVSQKEGPDAGTGQPARSEARAAIQEEVFVNIALRFAPEELKITEVPRSELRKAAQVLVQSKIREQELLEILRGSVNEAIEKINSRRRLESARNEVAKAMAVQDLQLRLLDTLKVYDQGTQEEDFAFGLATPESGNDPGIPLFLNAVRPGATVLVHGKVPSNFNGEVRVRGGLVRPESMSRRVELPGNQPDAAVVVLNKTAGLFHEMFRPFYLDLEASSDPDVRRLAVTILSVAAVHYARIVSANPELRLKPELLKTELLKRLQLFEKFPDILTLRGSGSHWGFGLSEMIVQKFLNSKLTAVAA